MKRSGSRLRSEAESRLAHLANLKESNATAPTLLHELQIHKIELEMQNEELRRAQIEIEESRDRYLDLYEYAPVAYLTLAPNALITEINLTGAQLLREDRRSILHRRFDRFVALEDHDRYHEMLARMAPNCERQTQSLLLRRTDGSSFHAQLDCVPSVTSEPLTIRLTIIDITERKAAEAEIASLAFYDPLTHLPNRRLLMDRILQASHASHRTSRHGAILALDLDGFKLLNDTQGHDAGDRILQQTARRLTTFLREVDTVGRLGGDEFVVVLEDLSEDGTRAGAQAVNVGEKVLTALGLPYFLGKQEYRSTGSMGVTLFTGARESVDEILKRADLALYRAKAAGGGVLQLFDPELEAAFKARILLESDFRLGIEERQFILHYQPQVGEDASVTGAEALVRWQHPSRGLLSPPDFISFAEEKGLVVALGRQVLEEACAQLAIWSAAPGTAHLNLSINISTLEFYQPDLVAHTLATMQRAGVDPGRLIFEITESLMSRNIEESIAKMYALKAHGVRFSLDDFGMGFTSLAYLKTLPLDQLKIDRSFVRDVLTDPSNAAIVRTIMTLGKTLGLSIIAEGVETEGQRDFLAALGCRAFQGNLFARPRPAAEFQMHGSLVRYKAVG